MNIDHDAMMRKMDTDFIMMCEKKNQTIYDKRAMLEDIEGWMEQKDDKLFELSALEQDLEIGREKHEENLLIIKKERATAIDKLRKEMLMNIRNVKMQMLDMNQD